MLMKAGIWMLTVLSAAIFLPASYMGLGSLGVLTDGSSPPVVVTYAVMWLLMPVLCVVGPLLGWRAAREGPPLKAFTLAALPLLGLLMIVLVIAVLHPHTTYFP